MSGGNGMRITDLDAWRRVCLEAFVNLPRDTIITMSDVDAVLMAGAVEASAADTETADGSARYEQLLDRVADQVRVGRDNVGAILTWCCERAAKLLASAAQALEKEVLALDWKVERRNAYGHWRPIGKWDDPAAAVEQAEAAASPETRTRVVEDISLLMQEFGGAG